MHPLPCAYIKKNTTNDTWWKNILKWEYYINCSYRKLLKYFERLSLVTLSICEEWKCCTFRRRQKKIKWNTGMPLDMNTKRIQFASCFSFISVHIHMVSNTKWFPFRMCKIPCCCLHVLEHASLKKYKAPLNHFVLDDTNTSNKRTITFTSVIGN